MSRPVCWLFVTSLAMVACAHSPPSENSNSFEGVFFDSAHDDHNRAPSSILPPADAANSDDRVDAVSLRSKADYFFAMGEAYSLEGQHQKAIEAFRSTILCDSRAATVHVRLAAEYVKMGLLSEATESVQTALKLDSKLLDAHLLLAGIYSSTREYDRALHEYEVVLTLAPDNTEAPMYMGAVYAERGEYDKAIRYFQSLAANEDFQAPYIAWYYIGRIHGEQSGKAHLKAAESAYKKALSLRSDHADSAIALGQIYQKLGQPQLAIETYRVFQRNHGPSDRIAEILAQHYLEKEEYLLALEQFEILERGNEDVLGVKVRIALILIEMKQYPRAADKLYEVLRQVPESDKIRFYLAAVYEEMRDFDHAIEHFRKVPSLSPFFAESVSHATYLLKSQKKLDDAISVVQESIEKRSDIAQLYTIAASLWDERGDLAKTEEYLKKGLVKFPNSVQLNFFLGTVLDRTGHRDQVIDQLRKVLEMDPNHVQTLNYLAFTFAEMSQNLDEAEGLAKRALEIEPRDGFILDTYGWILFRRGRVKESIPFLERAFSSQPQESVIAEHLGDAYHQVRLFEKARSMYQRALDKMEKTEDAKHLAELQNKLTSLNVQYKPREEERTPASEP